jgi:hypothetical protein
MKAIPCTIIVNNWIGYCFSPVSFPSINQAYRYGKEFRGGVYFRIFDLDGKFIKPGHCNSD